MKKNIIARSAAAMLLSFPLLSIALLAADIDGKWVLEAQGPNGKQTQTLTLKADAGKLNGTIDNQGTVVDGKVNIADGAIDGSKVTFTVVRELNGAQITRKFSGTVAGAELKLKAETVGGPGGGGAAAQEMVFKKQ